jgi:hypothetical protein
MGTPNPKIIKHGYVHLIHDGALVTLGPGDAVPEWAEVTNPALFDADDDAAAETTASTSTESTPATVNSDDTGAQSTETPPASVKEPSKAELVDQAKGLGISTAGSKADLTKRIAAKIAESAPEPEPAGDDEDGDRADLEDRARALNIEFTAETTDDELVAFIEDAQE